MTFEEWLEYGIKNDYCSPQFCNIHHGGPMTDREVALFEEGSDPCLMAVRLGCPQDWDLDAQAYKEIE